MMKLPTPSTGATAPSGSSFFGTKPGEFGSRVGGVGLAGAATGGWAAGWPAGVVAGACPGLACADMEPETATASSVSANTVLIKLLLVGRAGPSILSDSRIVRQSQGQ